MKASKTYKALDIALWFIHYSTLLSILKDEEMISNLKLQKLLYYAQGCYLGLKDEKLFNEDILAWEHGPVVDEVYQTYKEFGGKPIQVEQGDFDFENYKPIQQFLESIYAHFGKYSAWGLRNMTHEEDPWKNTPQSQVINTDLIKSYFKATYIQ